VCVCVCLHECVSLNMCEYVCVSVSVCEHVCVCQRLGQGGGASANTSSPEALGLADPSVTWQELEGPSQRSEVSIHAHHKQCPDLPTAQKGHSSYETE